MFLPPILLADNLPVRISVRIVEVHTRPFSSLANDAGEYALKLRIITSFAPCVNYVFLQHKNSSLSPCPTRGIHSTSGIGEVCLCRLASLGFHHVAKDIGSADEAHRRILATPSLHFTDQCI